MGDALKQILWYTERYWYLYFILFFRLVGQSVFVFTMEHTDHPECSLQPTKDDKGYSRIKWRLTLSVMYLLKRSAHALSCVNFWLVCPPIPGWPWSTGVYWDWAQTCRDDKDFYPPCASTWSTRVERGGASVTMDIPSGILWFYSCVSIVTLLLAGKPPSWGQEGFV